MSEATYAVAGVDVGKDTMHVVALDRSGAVALKARCSRATVLPTLLRLDVVLIAMEGLRGRA